MDLIDIVANKKKLKVIKELSNYKDVVSIREIGRETGTPPTTVYRIFKELEDIGLLKKKSVGKKSVYIITKKLKEFFPKDPLDDFINSIKNLAIEIQLIGRSEKGANLIVVTNEINKVKEIEKKFNSKEFKINSIILNKEQYKRLKEMRMIPNGKRIL